MCIHEIQQKPKSYIPKDVLFRSLAHHNTNYEEKKNAISNIIYIYYVYVYSKCIMFNAKSTKKRPTNLCIY